MRIHFSGCFGSILPFVSLFPAGCQVGEDAKDLDGRKLRSAFRGALGGEVGVWRDPKGPEFASLWFSMVFLWFFYGLIWFDYVFYHGFTMIEYGSIGMIMGYSTRIY